MAWFATSKPRAMLAQAVACLGRVTDPKCSTRKLQHFLQHHSMCTCKALGKVKKFQTVRSIHHGRSRQPRGLSGCVVRHSAFSLCPPALGTDLLYTPYAHEGPAATLPRKTTGIRRLLGGSGACSESENRSGRVPNLYILSVADLGTGRSWVLRRMPVESPSCSSVMPQRMSASAVRGQRVPDCI